MIEREHVDPWDGDVELIDDFQSVGLVPVGGLLRRVIVCCDCGLVHLMSVDAGLRRAYFVREDGPKSAEIRERGRAAGHFFPRERYDIDADHEWALWHEKWIASMDLVGSLGERLAIADRELEALLGRASRGDICAKDVLDAIARVNGDQPTP